MRLATKLTIWLFLGMSVILAANGALRVRREVAIVRAERLHDHAILGRSLAAAVSATWRLEGRAAALAMIAAVDAREARLHVAFVTLERALQNLAPCNPAPRWAEAGEPLTCSTADQRRTYVPISAAGEVSGALELVESLDGEHLRRRATIVDTAVAALALGVASAALAIVLGAWLVGRPIGLLVAKARNVGQGDFEGVVSLQGRDELGDLAREMNAMSVRLADARRQANDENAAKVAALDQLRHADRLTTIGKLASGVAHELGTPLNVIQGRASMIATGDAVGEEAARCAEIVVTSARQMTAIIRQLLDFARRRGPRKAECELGAVVRGVVDMVKPLARKRGVEITVAGDPVELEIDRAQIEQAITNLVMNAVQSSADPSTVTISVRRVHVDRDVDGVHRKGDFACLVVADQGEGIRPEDLSRVLEPFFTTKDVGEGTGLGLSVTYGIVLDHAGFIEIQSRLGFGSAFSVYLPTRA